MELIHRHVMQTAACRHSFENSQKCHVLHSILSNGQDGPSCIAYLDDNGIIRLKEVIFLMVDQTKNLISSLNRAIIFLGKIWAGFIFFNNNIRIKKRITIKPNLWWLGREKGGKAINSEQCIFIVFHPSTIFILKTTVDRLSSLSLYLPVSYSHWFFSPIPLAQPRPGNVSKQ